MSLYLLAILQAPGYIFIDVVETKKSRSKQDEHRSEPKRVPENNIGKIKYQFFVESRRKYK